MGDNVNAAFVEKKSRKSYSLEKKLQCIAAAKRLNNIDKAAELEGVRGTTMLKLSIGWRSRFLRRHRLTLRKPTSVAQKAPADYAEKIIKFITYTEQLRKKEKFKDVFGADETGIWINPAGGLCVEQIGAKDVTILSSGNTKLRITVMLTACSDGTRMKPLVLMPYGPKSRIYNKTNEMYRKDLHLVWHRTTWMDNETTKIYLENAFGGLFPKRLLVWDAFKAHTSEDTKKVLKALKLHSSVIPGGCTRFIQPADVSWNKPFKARFQALYDQWMLDGVHETTAAGNPKPPPPELYLK